MKNTKLAAAGLSVSVEYQTNGPQILQNRCYGHKHALVSHNFLANLSCGRL